MRLTMICILATSFFFLTIDKEEYVRLDSISKEYRFNDTTVDGKVTQVVTYQLSPDKIQIDTVEAVAKSLRQRLDYFYVCFRDEGSQISPALLRSDLIVTASYNNKIKEVARIINNEKTIGKSEACFRRVNNTIKPFWFFDSSLVITRSFLKDYSGAVLQPRGTVYLAQTNLIYLYDSILCLFYSGLFILSIETLRNFYKKSET